MASTRRILESLIVDGRVRRAFLGIVGGTRPLGQAVADRLGRARGLEVVQLLEPGPAASAGVRVGDIVVELDGSAIEGVGDLQRRLVGDVIGRRIDLRVERGGEIRVDLGHPGRTDRLGRTGRADPLASGAWSASSPGIRSGRRTRPSPR